MFNIVLSCEKELDNTEEKWMCALLCFRRVESFMYSSNYESIVNRIGRSEAFRIWVAVRKKFVTFCKDQGNNLISYSNFHHSCLSNPLSMVYGLNAMVRTPTCMKCHWLLCLGFWGAFFVLGFRALAFWHKRFAARSFSTFGYTPCFLRVGQQLQMQIKQSQAPQELKPMLRQ